MRRLSVAALAALALAGCGGAEPSTNDRETVNAVLSSSAEVQRALQPLMGCLPERPRCYARTGPELVRVVEEQQQRIAPVLAETDDECLAEVADLYNRSLDAYGDAGHAAVREDPAAVDSAISRSTDMELAYNRKLDECGFAEGRTAEMSAAIREVSSDLLRLGEEISACKTEGCIRDVAVRIEEKADEGVAVIDKLRDEEGEDMPICFRNAFATMRGAFAALGEAAAALEARNYAVAEEAGTRSDQLQVRALEQMAACLESLST